MTRWGKPCYVETREVDVARSHHSMAKRRREQSRMEKRRRKEERRAERKAAREAGLMVGGEAVPGEDGGDDAEAEGADGAAGGAEAEPTPVDG